MSRSSIIDDTLASFAAMAAESGLPARASQRLSVPYFAGEFNRCVEHEYLNTLLSGHVHPDDTGWHQISMACRIADTKKIEYGWHTTVFEMLTAIWRGDVSAEHNVRSQLASSVVRYLVGGFGLDLARLRVTYFAGDCGVPSIELGEDLAGRAAFIEAGISESNLIPIRGPKNFILFVGDGERAGPKYEIQYLVSHGQSEHWVEVATAIIDCYQFGRDSVHNGWNLRQPRSLLWGCAFGLERLLAARLNANSVWVSPPLSDLIAATREVSRQSPGARRLLDGDCMVLCDLIRSVMFLMADGVQASAHTANGRMLLGFIRRIRRKVEILSFVNWPKVIGCLADTVTSHYSRRYPSIAAAKTQLVHEVERVAWPDCWNPDTYCPRKHEDLSRD